MMNTRTLVVLLASLFVALGTACGGDSSEDNNTGSNNGADAGNNGGADVEEAVVPEDWTYESEYDLRFTAFRFNEGTPGAELNTLLRTRIRKQELEYPIVVLVSLKDIDTEAGSLSFRGGSGGKVELICDPELDGVCEYKWNENTSEEYTEGVPFDAETGSFSAELDSFDFVATFDADTRATIPITDLTFDAELLPFAYEDENGEVVVETAIEGGTLIGIVTEEDADGSMIKLPTSPDPKPLSDLLGKSTMNFDRDDDGTMDAWELEAQFWANEAIIVE
jgi:hypothetical protein